MLLYNKPTNLELREKFIEKIDGDLKDVSRQNFQLKKKFEAEKDIVKEEWSS